MLKWIQEALSNIVDFFTSVVDFVLDFISDLVYAIKLIGETVLNLPDFFGWLPGSIVTLLISLFAIVVIYKIIGREG